MYSNMAGRVGEAGGHQALGFPHGEALYHLEYVLHWVAHCRDTHH